MHCCLDPLSLSDKRLKIKYPNQTKTNSHNQNCAELFVDSQSSQNTGGAIGMACGEVT